MKPIHAPLFALLLLSLASGCTTESPVSSVSSTPLTGTLKGRVQFGSMDRADYPMAPGAATVSVEGTGISTTTDSLGRWQIDSLPAGTYDLSFTRSGFATRREVGFQFVGGGVAYLPFTFHLWKMTTVTLTDLTATIVDTSRGDRPGPYLYLTGRLNAP